MKVQYKGVNESSIDRNKSVNNLLLGAHARYESSHFKCKKCRRRYLYLQDNVELDETTKHTLSQQYVMICNFYLTQSSLNRLGTVIKYLGQINR